jgi:acetyltransferase-like isoleucine patch superfamily enzyme
MTESRFGLDIEVERLTLAQKIGIYAKTLSTSPARLPLEQLIFLLASWIPTPLGVGLRALLYPLILPAAFPLIVERGATLHRPGAIRLGRNVFLGENCYLLAGGRGISMGDYCQIMPNVVLMIRDYRGIPNAGIEIGHHVGINVGTIVFSHGRTRIGDNALIGPGVVISTAGHAFEDPSQPVRTQPVTVADIEIGAGSWIGSRAVIMPGVQIGPGAVVGAGAVVTQDVPANSLAVGVPARVVRQWGASEARTGS